MHDVDIYEYQPSALLCDHHDNLMHCQSRSTKNTRFDAELKMIDSKISSHQTFFNVVANHFMNERARTSNAIDNFHDD